MRLTQQLHLRVFVYYWQCRIINKTGTFIFLSTSGKTSAALDAYSKARQHAARLKDRTLHNQIKKTMQGL